MGARSRATSATPLGAWSAHHLELAQHPPRQREAEPLPAVSNATSSRVTGSPVGPVLSECCEMHPWVRPSGHRTSRVLTALRAASRIPAGPLLPGAVSPTNSPLPPQHDTLSGLSIRLFGIRASAKGMLPVRDSVQRAGLDLSPTRSSTGAASRDTQLRTGPPSSPEAPIGLSPGIRLTIKNPKVYDLGRSSTRTSPCRE